MIDAGGPGENPLPVADPEPQKSPLEAPGRQEPEPPETTPPAEEPSPAPADDGAEAPKQEGLPPEVQKRIDRLNWEKYEAQRQRDEMRAEYQRWAQQQQQAAQPANSEYERGRREAQDARVAETFNQACNSLFSRGLEEYGQEMGEARDRLNAVGWGNRPDALAAVTQLPDGHRVYRELSRDLDRAARVLSLPPMAMAMELTRMSSTPEGDALREITTDRQVPVSKVPEPVSRIGGHSRPAERPLDHPQTSMAEFIRRRDALERRSRISR